jgi:hypothetical protein
VRIYSCSPANLSQKTNKPKSHSLRLTKAKLKLNSGTKSSAHSPQPYQGETIDDYPPFPFTDAIDQLREDDIDPESPLGQAILDSMHADHIEDIYNAIEQNR